MCGLHTSKHTWIKHQTTNQGKSRQVRDQLPEGSPKGQTKSSMATLLGQRPAVKQAGGCGSHSRSWQGHRPGTWETAGLINWVQGRLTESKAAQRPLGHLPDPTAHRAADTSILPTSPNFEKCSLDSREDSPTSS